MAIAKTNLGVNWIIRLAVAMLVVALSFVIVKAIITFLNPKSTWRQPAITSAASQKTITRGIQNFKFSTDPFNRTVAAEPQIIAEIGEDAPETTLNLTLTGRIAGSDGSAILRTPDNKQGNYKLGEEIVSGVTLQAVNKDFIVLDVDGQIQRLTFDRGDDTGLIKKPALEDAKAQGRLSVKVPAGETPISGQAKDIPKDVSQLFQDISLRRVMKDGHLTGYSVKANRPGIDLTSFGFSKGDIITNIGGNDITIGRPDLIALFEQAEKDGGMDVTVLRNGQIKTITLRTP